MIKTLKEAVKYLELYIPTPDKKHPGSLGLERMKYLMGLLGNPQLQYPTIHVGGTSGKGSTSTIIASILATKYKVGLHTSPHLVKINERIKVYGPNDPGSFLREFDPGSYISDKDFINLANYIKPFVDKLEESEFGVPSYWEIVTAIGFLYFFREKVDIAVIEVGLGGRFDASNVINPLVAILTNVGLDHTEILGDTVEKIAEDKVGIIKPGVKVVTGATQPSVIRIIEEKCKKEKAKLSLLVPPPFGRESLYTGHPRGVFESFNYHIKKLDSEGSVFDYKGGKLLRLLKSLKLRLLGEHQVENATLAIRAIEKLSLPRRQAGNYPIIQLSNDQIREGLKTAFIPGRLEIIRKNPLVILDGAHNPDKVKALVDAIKEIFPKRKVTTIIAIKNDKNANEMLSQLLNISKKVIFTKFDLTADIGVISSYDPRELLQSARTIDKNKPMIVINDSKKALAEAIKSANSDDVILITGSLYLVGEIKNNYEG